MKKQTIITAIHALIVMVGQAQANKLPQEMVFVH